MGPKAVRRTHFEYVPRATVVIFSLRIRCLPGPGAALRQSSADVRLPRPEVPFTSEERAVSLQKKQSLSAEASSASPETVASVLLTKVSPCHQNVSGG